MEAQTKDWKTQFILIIIITLLIVILIIINIIVLIINLIIISIVLVSVSSLSEGGAFLNYQDFLKPHGIARKKAFTLLNLSKTPIYK